MIPTHDSGKTSAAFHLAQVNIARMKAPLDDPLMAEFTQAIAEINALADASPGFVWRLKTEQGDATGVRAYEDSRILFNLSVWRSIEALKDYAYRSVHGRMYARRRAWFDAMEESHLALWWIPIGNIPTVPEARARLEFIAKHGPTQHAFTFKKVFSPDGSEVA